MLEFLTDAQVVTVLVTALVVGLVVVFHYEVISLLDSVYFSAATYTTVGWGDLAATGHIRFLAGTEALVGFMMITWSASFSYLIMARAWGSEND